MANTKTFSAASIKTLISGLIERLKKGEKNYVDLPGLQGTSLYVEKSAENDTVAVEVLNSDAVTTSVLIGPEVSLDQAAAAVLVDCSARAEQLSKAVPGKVIEGDEQKV